MNRILHPWRTLHPVTRAVALFALATMVLGILGPILFAGASLQDTTFRYTANLLAPERWGRDSWRPMSLAYQHISTAPPRARAPLYTQLFFTEREKFIYPPSSLLVLAALDGAGVPPTTWDAVLNSLSALALAATVAGVWLILETGLQSRLREAPGAFSRWDRIARAVCVLLLTLTFFPLVFAVTLGQVQAWINALVTWLILCWLRRGKSWAGVLGGLTALLKPQAALFLLWGLARREGRFSAAFGATAAAGLLLSGTLLGFADLFNYADVLGYISQRGEAYFSNQSVNGLLNRLFHTGPILQFDLHAYPAYHPWVHAGTLASSAALVALALLWPARGGPPGDAVDLSLIVIASIMASPVAWRHHYGPLLAVFAVLFPLLATPAQGKPALWPLAALSYLLISTHVRYVQNLEFVAGKFWFVPMSLSLSYLFAGAVLLLGTIYLAPSRQWWQAPA